MSNSYIAMFLLVAAIVFIPTASPVTVGQLDPQGDYCLPWMEWSACSATCDDGTKYTTTRCRNIYKCQNEDPYSVRRKTESCNDIGCDQWLDWDPYQCKPNVPGTQIRTRACTVPGRCVGDDFEENVCSLAVDCPPDSDCLVDYECFEGRSNLCQASVDNDESGYEVSRGAKGGFLIKIPSTEGQIGIISFPIVKAKGCCSTYSFFIEAIRPKPILSTVEMFYTSYDINGDVKETKQDPDWRMINGKMRQTITSEGAVQVSLKITSNGIVAEEGYLVKVRIE